MKEHDNNPDMDNIPVDNYRRAARLLEGLAADVNVPPWLRDKLRNWFASSASEEEKYGALKELFEGMRENRDPDRYDYESLLKVQEIIGFPEQYKVRLPAKRIPLRRRLLRVAMVVIPALIVAGVAFTWKRNVAEPVVMVANVLLTVGTSVGEQKNVLLPDSSRVWLNGSTTISYSTGVDCRTVNLEGEAYFSVKAVDGSRFTVETESLTATVLGTSFNVRAFPGSDTEVELDEGSLEIAVEDRKTVMRPGDRVMVSEHDRGFVLEERIPDMATEWRRGLEFKDTPLTTALASIASHFNMELEISGSLPEDMIRFGFDHDASPNTVLSILASTLDYFTYRIDPPRIIILTD